MDKIQLLRKILVPFDRFLPQKYPNRAGILAYHRITPQLDHVAEPTYNVEPEIFDRQLRGLLKMGFTPWPLERLVKCHLESQQIPANVFIVTFDDGYECIYQHAWPVLKMLEIPATVFLATKYLSTNIPFPFDDWEAKGSPQVPVESWRPLTIEQCKEMANSGLIELGAHTHAHLNYRTDPDSFIPDLSNCINFLRDTFGISNPTLSYPFGYYSTNMTQAVQQIGLSCGLTTDEELISPASDPCSWGRFEVYQQDSTYTLSVCLNGWYEYARNALKPAQKL